MPRLTMPLVVLGLISVAGCATSKWAIDDPVYREKYDRPYESGNKIPRMIKQSVDARHVKDRDGMSLGFAAASDPTHVGGEIGWFGYSEPWMESRVSLAGLFSDPGDAFFGGVNAGFRLQSPSRVAPFVGLGTFVGLTDRDVIADNDGRDNNDNRVIDERGELDDKTDGFISIYPELGVHAWLTSKCRITGSVSYHISSEGRDNDFVFFGVSFSWMDAPESAPTPLSEETIDETQNAPTEPDGLLPLSPSGKALDSDSREVTQDMPQTD